MADYLIVRASRPRRRSGRRFGKTPVRVKLADLTEDQIAAIKADPVLSVREDTSEKKPKGKDGSGVEAVASATARPASRETGGRMSAGQKKT